MKTERFLDAMNELPVELIAETGPARQVRPRRRALRTVLLAAVFAMLLTVTAYAAGGNLVGYSTSLRPGSSWTELRYLPRVEKRMGLELRVPESFANGFVFGKMELLYTDHTDAEGKIVETFPELNARYRREGADVTLSAEREREQIYDSSWTRRDVEGVTLWYRSFTYKAVPADYQETEADRALKERGELMIGWGSERIELMSTSYVQFALDGTLYNLLNMDGVSVEELCAMAEEIIGQNQ